MAGLIAAALGVSLVLQVFPPLPHARAASAPAGVNYVYDELGRLVTAVDPAGQIARYNYDAAGNVTSIIRQAPPNAGIVDFNPRSGRVGTEVTVLGQGFDPDPAKNSVTFNGVAAELVSAYETRLVAKVSPNATTGPIKVTTPAASYTSSLSFKIPPRQPAITGFTPKVASGGATVQVTGINFQPKGPRHPRRPSNQRPELLASSEQTGEPDHDH